MEVIIPSTPSHYHNTLNGFIIKRASKLKIVIALLLSVNILLGLFISRWLKTCIHTHDDYQYQEFNSFNFSRTWSQFLQFKKWAWHFSEIRLTNISGLLQSALTFKLQFWLFVPVSFEIICTSCNEFGCFPFPFPSICILDSVKFNSISFWNLG